MIAAARASLLFMAALAACSVGCGPARPQADLAARLQDEDPSVRAEAAIEAGRHDRQDVLALLVERLDDREETVRMVSIVSLEKLTRQRMGYCYYHSREDRQKAIARWRNWLERRQTSRPAPQTPDGDRR